MLVEVVCSFVEKELLFYEDDVDCVDVVLLELVVQICGKVFVVGFYVFNMFEEVGGGGFDYLFQVLVECELLKVFWVFYVFVVWFLKIFMVCIGEQFGDYLLFCVQGEKIDCFVFIELGVGFDVNLIKICVVCDGDVFVINGSKYFISYVGYVDFVIVFVVIDSYEYNGCKCNVVIVFLVDKGMFGMIVCCGLKCVSNCGYYIYEIFFDDCWVLVFKVFGEVGKGWEVVNVWFIVGWVMVVVNCVGQVQCVFDLLLCWVVDCKQFGQLIGSYQGVFFKFVDMVMQICVVELMVLYIVWKMDQGIMIDGEVGMVKLFVSEIFGKVVDEVVQIFGGMGLMDEGLVECIWCNVWIEWIWEGILEIQWYIVFCELLWLLLC